MTKKNIAVQEAWQQRVEKYWSLLKPKIESNTIRNVMDMKANIGSFAAALKNEDVWVMNTVSDDAPNTLKVIYDRGLIGAVHNWYLSSSRCTTFGYLRKSMFSLIFFFFGQV